MDPSAMHDQRFMSDTLLTYVDQVLEIPCLDGVFMFMAETPGF
jgi:hypothetical protein